MSLKKMSVMTLSITSLILSSSLFAETTRISGPSSLLAGKEGNYRMYIAGTGLYPSEILLPSNYRFKVRKPNGTYQTASINNDKCVREAKKRFYCRSKVFKYKSWITGKHVVTASGRVDAFFPHTGNDRLLVNASKSKDVFVGI